MAAPVSDALSDVDGGCSNMGKRVAPGTPVGGERKHQGFSSPEEKHNREKVARLRDISAKLSPKQNVDEASVDAAVPPLPGQGASLGSDGTGAAGAEGQRA